MFRWRVALSGVFLFGCFFPAWGSVQNVVLFIGDGMGPAVITATRNHFVGKKENLHVDRFPYTAKVKTYSQGYQVTDSAASGTAMATGVKVENGVVGRGPKASPPKTDGFPVGKDRQGKAIKNILELAAEKGKRVGVVTSSHIFHATPSAFYAHSNYRNNFEKIMDDLAVSPIHILYGGGFDRISPHLKKFGKRFNVLRTLPKKEDCSANQTIGVFAKEHLSWVYGRKKEDPIGLQNLTNHALQCLSQHPGGFFLMVEGARIDHALHKRLIINTLYEMKEFDDTIGSTLAFLNKKKLADKTLVLVTADHDTGGLSINAPLADSKTLLVKVDGKDQVRKIRHYSGKGSEYPALKLNTDLAAGNVTNSTHTAVDVTLYAQGPTSEKVKGTIENTKVFELMKSAFGF